MRRDWAASAWCP
uniref:Uncharacterized protein n=1 Tax=Arundo donax TaxID=35708 RepID=A0A0A8ZND1_ARUDO